MLVSRKWLSEYVQPNMPVTEWVERLTMSGLNHDGSSDVGSDQCINLEVTSNRPDCLGHLGIAREIATVTGSPLRIPDPQPPTGGEPVDRALKVEIQAPELCFRFTARLIRGVKIGPSPSWLVERLATVGLASVNNIVDITNYVMLECGQPLHAFDYPKLRGQTILVREPQHQETLLAIDHREYPLEGGMCVIADAQRAVGLGGVMGGADTEISTATKDVLIEAAHFHPMAIRRTARKLNLHSAASYRFERTVDGRQIDWASRRCCQLILEIAGGELAPGMIDVGSMPPEPEPIRLRQPQIQRVLGIQIPQQRGAEILAALGFSVKASSSDGLTATPPSWRRDVTREVDLIEEIGRVYGYDQVPDDRPVPMVASHRRTRDRLIDRVRRMLTGCGFDEAMTCSMVPDVWSDGFSPWSDEPPLQSLQPMLGVLEKSSHNIGPVCLLRRSLVPSLLESFRINEHRGNDDVHLFEIAHVYLTRKKGLPDEPSKVALVSDMDFYGVKGVIESLVTGLHPGRSATVTPMQHPWLEVNWSAGLELGGRRLGYIGITSAHAKRTFGLRRTACVAELDLATLVDGVVTTPLYREISPYPAIERDFNFIVAESVRWSDLEQTVRQAAGELLESVSFKELFRDRAKDGADRKRLLLTVVLRSIEQTLTGEQADAVSQSIVRACGAAHDAKLVS